jgi:hypothetical protein
MTYASPAPAHQRQIGEWLGRSPWTGIHGLGRSGCGLSCDKPVHQPSEVTL